MPPRTKSEPAAPRLFVGDTALGFDPEVARAHVCTRDRPLARLIDEVGPFGMQLESTSSAFAALAQAIVYQQLTAKAAATIHDRLCALFPRSTGGPTPRQILRADDATLRSAGLSRGKVLALKDLARRTIDRTVPTLEEAREMDDDAIVARLTEVRGIGPWTAQMFLMFRLGRPDVLPVDDYGIRKGFAIAFRKRALPSPKDVAKRGARWAPYRTFACWYLWRAVDAGAT